MKEAVETQRGVIFPERARIAEQIDCGAEQYHLRLHAPLTAKHAVPGQFVHLQCDPSILHRRPMSIMRTDAQRGYIDVLYKIHGEGTLRLAEQPVGKELELLGPIGKGFSVSSDRPRSLLIGGGVGIPPMIFMAQQLHEQRDCQRKPVALFGSEIPFPFTPQPSRILWPAAPKEAIASLPLLDDWGIPSRLASWQAMAGCYHGFVTDLARHVLEGWGSDLRDETEIFACGPEPMLRATAALAREFALPCQISLEEYMACAVGGCAGCTVPVHEDAGLAMRRVCVDGPVFDAARIYP
ncbi:MAG: dihydroorotate dehydrogenase electron transfer subunit [Candidatus Eutrophobiaceae bacterium]